MFTMTPGPEGRGTATLVPTAGLLNMTILNSFPIRAFKAIENVIYAVAGNRAYKITINLVTEVATTLEIGTLSTTTGDTYIAANPTQIMFVDGTDGYIYTVGSGAFAIISDADFPTLPGGVVFLDGYFITFQTGTGLFYTSALNNGLAWDAADVATAESNMDKIVGLGVVKGDLWLFGTISLEIWYNAANVSGSPFSPRDGLELRTGCGAAKSIVELDDLLIWLDNRGFIVQSAISPFVRSNNSGYELKIVSDEALTTEILSYADRSDAIAMSYNDRGHLMYQITFPSEHKTWVFDYTSKSWHERSFYNAQFGADEYHLAQYAANVGQLTIMAGIRNGRIFKSSPSVYEDFLQPIRRRRVTALQHDVENYNLIGVDRVAVRIGIADSNVVSPKITMRYSNDGGHTWSHHLIRDLGAVGEYAKSITWNRLGVAREWLFEFSIVEPMPFSIIDATAIASVEN